MSDFPKWKYTRIELEILGVVTEIRFVQKKDYQRILNLYIAYGKMQPFAWAVFVKRHYSKKTLYMRLMRNKKSAAKRRLDKAIKK